MGQLLYNLSTGTPTCQQTCVVPALQDYFHQGNRNGGQNYCTVLMYLSDVEEGGETVSWLAGRLSLCCERIM